MKKKKNNVIKKINGEFYLDTEELKRVFDLERLKIAEILTKPEFYDYFSPFVDVSLYEYLHYSSISRLFYKIREEKLDLLIMEEKLGIIERMRLPINSGDTYKFMGFSFKKLKIIEEKISKIEEIRKEVLHDLGNYFICGDPNIINHNVDNLKRIGELCDFAVEEIEKLHISCDNEIDNRLKNGESGIQIFYEMYEIIFAELEEIKYVTQEEIDEYERNEEQLKKAFFV